MGMDAVFVHMAKNYYLTGKAYWVDSSVVSKIRERAKILEPILIGKKAPNMWLTDSSGKLYTLDGFKAKSTILYFWDPNCGHCQKETPKLLEFWEKNKARGIDVYSVTIDRKPDDWKKYIREKKLSWLNVWDSYTATDFKNNFTQTCSHRNFNQAGIIHFSCKCKYFCSRAFGCPDFTVPFTSF